MTVAMVGSTSAGRIPFPAQGPGPALPPSGVLCLRLTFPHLHPLAHCVAPAGALRGLFPGSQRFRDQITSLLLASW